MEQEWKIGEIKQVNGEWYQCIESHSSCEGCDFKTTLKCSYAEAKCSFPVRQDHTSVIFKKLEKVGEEFLYKGKQMQSYIRATDELICNWNNNLLLLEHGDSDIIDIEIKQNTEDMEEKKLIELLSEKVHNAWMKEKEAQGFSYGKDYDKEKKKHPDMLPYNELKEEVKEYDRATVRAVLQAQKELQSKYNYNNLKPFDLEAAKAGKPVYTRDGRKARIVCFDSNGGRPIVALVTECDDEEEMPYKYHCDGFYNCQAIPSDNDLMMLPEKKEGWINVYDADTTFRFVEGMVYNTKDEAIQRAKEEVTNGQREKNEYVDTVKICWEE